jgi:hypothetical protein
MGSLSLFCEVCEPQLRLRCRHDVPSGSAVDQGAASKVGGLSSGSKFQISDFEFQILSSEAQI